MSEIPKSKHSNHTTHDPYECPECNRILSQRDALQSQLAERDKQLAEARAEIARVKSCNPYLEGLYDGERHVNFQLESKLEKRTRALEKIANADVHNPNCVCDDMVYAKCEGMWIVEFAKSALNEDAGKPGVEA